MSEQRCEDSTAPMQKAASNGDVSFEEAFRRLETIVSSLETGRGELEDSLAKYEEGIRLLRRCRQILDGAERRVEFLKGLDENGVPILERADENALRSQTDVAGRQTPPASAPKKTDAPPPNASVASNSNPNSNANSNALPKTASSPSAVPPNSPLPARRVVRRPAAKPADFPPSDVESPTNRRSDSVPKSRSFFDDEPPF